MSEDQGNESSDESDDSDDEHGRRRRFKMERQGSIQLSTHKSGTDIPDTLGQCVFKNQTNGFVFAWAYFAHMEKSQI